MGIPSRAAYLMADGLTAEGRGTSIGRNKTENIFYRALTTYLQASSQFLDARIATLQAAEDLYGAGSTEVSAVQASWDAVEVTEGNVGAPEDQTPTPTDSASGEDLMVYLYPTDGTHDKPYDIDETYDLYAQTIPSPFTGYDPILDVGPLNTYTSAAYTRPAAYTGPEGTVIFYVGSDNNLYAVDTQGNDTQITDTDPGYIWSFAISPDGGYFAYTTVDPDDNNIYVGDLETGLVTEYPVESPSDLPPGSEEVLNTIFYVDSLAFDYTGKTIVFDALNCLSTPEDTCDNGGGYQYWSIGFLNLSNNTFDFPFPNQSPDFNIEYPSFAYNNSFVVVFDLLDYSDYDTDGTVSSMVWTINSQTQDSAQIADPNLGSNTRGVAGVPSFWGDDDYVTIQRLSDTHGDAFRIPIDASWEGNANDVAQRLNDFDVAMPVMHRAVVRTLTCTIQPSPSSLDFGNISLGGTSSMDLTLTNTGNRDLDIYNIAISDSSAFSHNGSNALLPRDQSMTFRVTFSPGQTSGTLSGTLVITSDADNPTLSIALTGTGDFENGGGFDYQSYLVANPDLPGSWGKAECMNHYIHYGFWENRAVSFNLDEYLNANPDLPRNWTYEEALNHYNLYGKNENRLLAFDAQEYLSLYSDLPQDWGYDQAYNHFMNYGRQEGRIASFDETAYLEMYSDLPQSWGQAEAFYHYFYYGINEGRVYDPYDESVFDGIG